MHSLLDPARLTIVVNTGDDETFFGLHVSPDVDTIIYTLAGRVDRERGWGVAGDSSACLAALQRYYDQDWFRLGDADLATHVYRTDRLRRGVPLSKITAAIARRHGLRARILPMSDDPVRTIVEVARRGALPFQRYLVQGRGRGAVRDVRFAGVEHAHPAPRVLPALERAGAIVIPPSNPFVSIEPILALPGVRAALRRKRKHVAAISPLVGGTPVKGPLDRMMRGLGHEVSSAGVAELYRGLADLFVLDRHDAHLAPRVAALGMRTLVTDTLMTDAARSRALARKVLEALAS